jgi:hypothetical protein
MTETREKHSEPPCCTKGGCQCAGDRRQRPADTSDPDFVERRSGLERRQNVVDRRVGLDRRRGPGRRRSEDRKAAEEGQMSDEQFEFVMAIDEYKRANSRPFPTWTEVLEVIKALGYRRVAEPQSLAEAQSDTGKAAKARRRQRQSQLAK